MDNINRHVLRLRQLAVAAKAAADAEDYAMNAGNEGEPPARDPASLQRVEQVRLTSGEVERMTPQLITAAQVCMKHICLRIFLHPEKIKKKHKTIRLTVSKLAVKSKTSVHVRRGEKCRSSWSTLT